MKFKPIDANTARSECGKYTVLRQPGNNNTEHGAPLYYTLCFGGNVLTTERCRNHVAERVEAMSALEQFADEHARGANA